MNKVKSSYYNIIASIIQQAISIILGFVSRMLFIHILGVEMLGLSSTFESVLGTLALADLGIQRAITYSLYKPFADSDYPMINKVLCIYKWFYRLVAVIIVIGALVCFPFLNNIISGIEFKNIFYLYFILQAAGSASSYLLAYKRVLLFVDQKDYVTKIIDSISSFCFLILKIAVIYFFKNFALYLIIQISQVVVSNLFVHIVCVKIYPFVENVHFDKNLFKRIGKDMKEVVFGKFASFVYDSTDNLVISSFISTVFVGMLGNYTLITSSIKKIINSIVNPLAPVIGGMIAEGDINAKRSSFKICTHFCFVVALFLLVPTFGLIDKFITIWIGNEYLLPRNVSFLIVLDLFIFTLQGICCSYIFGEGLFKLEKYVDIITALMNLSISIVLAILIGVEGVLIGTVISELFMLFGRSYIVSKYIIRENKKFYFKLMIKDMIKFLFFFVLLLASNWISKITICNNPILDFIMSGLIIVAITILVYLVAYWKTEENKKMFNIFLRIVRRPAMKSQV